MNRISIKEKVIALAKTGMTHKAIAEKLGAPKGTVSSAIYTAKKEGLLPKKDGRGSSTRTKSKYNKKRVKVTEIPMGSAVSPSDNFVIIVGKGASLLADILNQVRLT